MTSTSSKPRILVTRAIFPQVIDRLSEHFEVETNPADDLWDRAELLRRLQGKVGVFTTGVERMDAALLAHAVFLLKAKRGPTPAMKPRWPICWA